MNVLVRVAAAAALMVPMVAAPASAQHYKADFGLNAGYSWYSALLGSDETGITTDADDARFKANWLVGAQAGYWFTPKIGARLNGTYTDTNLKNDDNTIHDNINLWTATADLLWRFRQPNEEWMGSEFLPFLALGLGAKFINPAGDPFQCAVAGDDAESCLPFNVPPGSTSNQFYLDEGKVLTGLVGLGADYRVSPNFAVRFEIDDRIYKPEVYSSGQVVPTGNTWTVPNDENVAKVVHEISGQIGLHILAGLQAPPVVAIAPTPPPPPPAPTPPPAPREDDIMVCVIDPTAPEGLRMQEAIYLVESGDTVIEMNGQRRPLSSSVGTVVVAGNQDWYVRGQPLVVEVGPDQSEFLTYQGARMIESNRLAYLGTVDGLPVYADRDQVADVRDQMADLREERRSNDLEDILDEEDDLREAIDAIQVVYVPLQPTGCVFQPMMRQQQVRKGK